MQPQHQIIYAIVNFVKTLYQRNIIINHIWIDVKFIKSNCIDDEFKQQLKHDILNVVKMFSDALKDDVADIKQTKTLSNLIISW